MDKVEAKICNEGDRRQGSLACITSLPRQDFSSKSFKLTKSVIMTVS